jgi:hypothetical protein
MPFPKGRSHELESTALGRDLTSPELKLIVSRPKPVALAEVTTAHSSGSDEQMFGAE